MEQLLGAQVAREGGGNPERTFAKAAYESFVCQTARMGAAMTNIASESAKPFEGMLARAARP